MSAIVETILSETPFSTSYKDEINNFIIIAKAKKSKRNIIIWGAGFMGEIVYTYLFHRSYTPLCFVDSNQDKVGIQKMGIDVISPDVLFSKHKDDLVIIGIGNKVICNEIQKILNENNVDSIPYIYSDAPTWCLHHIETVVANDMEIQKVYDFLQDDLSKNVFRGALISRMCRDVQSITPYYTPNQYFNNDVIGDPGSAIVDCGAHDGHASPQPLNTYIQFLKEDSKYYALEPSKNGFNTLKEFIDTNRIPNVEVLNIGAWSSKAVLSFLVREEYYSGNNHIVDDISDEIGNCEISVDTIDSILHGTGTDFIKMDIEGAEIEALQGAEKTIRNHRPKLAICAYHSLEHHWKIPLLIKTYFEGYKIYFRHHHENEMIETVCYAVM